jgi:hypothetical protein
MKPSDLPVCRYDGFPRCDVVSVVKHVLIVKGNAKNIVPTIVSPSPASVDFVPVATSFLSSFVKSGTSVQQCLRVTVARPTRQTLTVRFINSLHSRREPHNTDNAL